MLKKNHIISPSKGKFTDETCSILVIDDDEFVLSALKFILEYEGYNVLTASDGDTAINQIVHHLPAIILCDQIMPGITGVDVLKKAQEISPDSIRILLTATADSQMAIDAIEAGHIHLCLSKPWRNASLLESIKNSIEQYKSVKENRDL